MYRRAAAVVTVTKGFAKDIASRGIRADKIYVITNGVSDEEVEQAPTYQGAPSDRLRSELQLNPLTKVFLYIGAHGISQQLGQIVDAARLLMNKSDILFLFVGDGADKARVMDLAKGMPNVMFLDSQPKERVWAFYALAYASFVPLRDIEGFSTFIPSKMFEIMAAGTPAIGCVRGEAAHIMSQSGAIVTPPEDAEKLAKAVVTLANDTDRAEKMGQQMREFVTAHYTHSKLATQYMGIFKKLTTHPTPGL